MSTVAIQQSRKSRSFRAVSGKKYHLEGNRISHLAVDTIAVHPPLAYQYIGHYLWENAGQMTALE